MAIFTWFQFLTCFMGFIFDIPDKRNAPCEEFANVKIERLPARCIQYFSK